jgi:hypothetical protein
VNERRIRQRLPPLRPRHLNLLALLRALELQVKNHAKESFG